MHAFSPAAEMLCSWREAYSMCRIPIWECAIPVILFLSFLRSVTVGLRDRSRLSPQDCALALAALSVKMDTMSTSTENRASVGARGTRVRASCTSSPTRMSRPAEAIVPWQIWPACSDTSFLPDNSCRVELPLTYSKQMIDVPATRHSGEGFENGPTEERC